MFIGPIVDTVTVTDCGVPLTCTEVLDKPQVGAGVTTGLTLQPRLTVPVKPPVPAN